MLKTRVIPCLLLKNNGLVKTVKFKNAKYVGDPINAVKIFNEKEVDELLFLDIEASKQKKKPNFDLISQIASECFMPFGYGGGINSIEDIRKILKIGVEKVIVNTFAISNPNFIKEASSIFGSSTIVVSLDVKKNFWGHYKVMDSSQEKITGIEVVEFAQLMEKNGAGEIFLNSVDRDGTMEGFDFDLIKKVSSAVDIPVIACGGASSIQDFKTAVQAGASAISAGSLFVFHGKHKAVLITYPGIKELESILIN